MVDLYNLLSRFLMSKDIYERFRRFRLRILRFLMTIIQYADYHCSNVQYVLYVLYTDSQVSDMDNRPIGHHPSSTIIPSKSVRRHVRTQRTHFFHTHL